MKHKEIMQADLGIPQLKNGKGISAAPTEHYLILDIYEYGRWYARHATDITTGEYETWKIQENTWHRSQLTYAVVNSWWQYHLNESEYPLSEADAEMILEILTGKGDTAAGAAYARISMIEQEYARGKRERKEMRRRERIDSLMALFEDPTEEVGHWITDIITHDLQYAFYDNETGEYGCTACGGYFTAKHKDKEQTICPLCGKPVQIRKHTKRVTKDHYFTIIQPLDDERSAERLFWLGERWSSANYQPHHTIYMEERIRLVFDRQQNFKIYYCEYPGHWETRNTNMLRWHSSYLYPWGIRKALEGTAYDGWKDVFPMMAAAGQRADYNRLMASTCKPMECTAEYLLKGRFYRLLTEMSEMVDLLMGALYTDRIHPEKQTIEGVLGIRDRQLINRLRQENGGMQMLEWLQYSDSAGVRISQDVMGWLDKAHFSPYKYKTTEAAKHFTPEQLKNYIERQKRESYPGKSAKAILEQYEDYIRMVADLGKDTSDEMVYRPRELKRRHDECVEELNRIREEEERKRNKELARKQAREMRKKYPGYEKILKEVREKYEFATDTYQIRVPKNFAEITAEGMALHHCVGSTERYFDRIVSRETYIVFLRKTEDPNTPFYTIEVEPGGTIRQHRGAYDEEPDIEQIKPFLRQWQKEIRKRMSRKDRSYAEQSAKLRQKNIEELIAQNNKRVLDGLREDFMDAEMQEVSNG